MGIKFPFVGLLLVSANAVGYAQERRQEVRCQAELGRPVQEMLAGAACMELMGPYRYGRAGAHLAFGYARSGRWDSVYNNVHDYHSRGFFLKPGLVLFSREHSFQVGIAFGLAFLKEQGEARISGPGWGDKYVLFKQESTERYLEFFIAQNIRITSSWYAYLGATQGLHLARAHQPVYVPGYGPLHHPYFAYIRAGLGFTIPTGPAVKPRLEDE